MFKYKVTVTKTDEVYYITGKPFVDGDTVMIFGDVMYINNEVLMADAEELVEDIERLMAQQQTTTVETDLVVSLDNKECTRG